MRAEPIIPSAFLNRIREQGVEPGLFEEILHSDSPVSVRLNRAKLPIDHPWLEMEYVPWDGQGRYLLERPAFSKDPFYHGGVYYPMEASSMLLAHVIGRFHLAPDARILDLCAAPGGKSLILKDHFSELLLVSNEIDLKRAQVLKENSIRWGTDKHIVINSDAMRLGGTGVQFDLVLVDAPCSGEGLFRKDPPSRAEWTPEKARGCAIRQRQILDDVPNLMKTGGILIYSTCTYNPEENIAQCDHLVEHFHMEPLRIPMDEAWGLEIIQGNSSVGYQCWPHKVRGEGFFIAAFRKMQGSDERDRPLIKPVKSNSDLPDWLYAEDHQVMRNERGYTRTAMDEWALAQEIRSAGLIMKSGLFLGTEKGGQFAPSYDLAMHPDSVHAPQQLEIELVDALKYLRGEALTHAAKRDHVLLQYRGVALGWGKMAGNRINNLYPKHLRLRN
ncbi:MAG: hypothetical protein H6606_04705 [Flavobacteriales bacterium]|nr:hypothetical protein [Flavobacteriales bacterium]